MFSFAVSPIEPGERKRVEVSYGQWLARHVSTVELRAPITRPDSDDHRDDLGRARAARDRVAHAQRGRAAPEQRALPGARAAGEGATRRRSSCATRSPTSRWTPAGYVHRDKDQDAYFTLTLAAPELPASATMAKDVTLVIDRSGSMMGEAIRQARAACIDIVKRLRSDDRVNIIAFDHAVEKLFAEPQPVTEAIRRQAIEYLEMMDDGGATDLALRAGAGDGVAGERRTARASSLFFTDGQSDVAAGAGGDAGRQARRARVHRRLRRRRQQAAALAAGGAQARSVHVHRGGGEHRARGVAARTGRSTRPCWSTSRSRRRAAP